VSSDSLDDHDGPGPDGAALALLGMLGTA